jgi:long-chain acyl-CoA synthetase
MFGQSMALYIPIFLGGAVAFTDQLQPANIVNVVRSNRISVIVGVPRLLELLRQDVSRWTLPQVEERTHGIVTRWIRYRKVHSRFGWKFWAFVVGGARLDARLEEFWSRMGFVVVQGYGLTEASPVVAVNHPFSARRGSLGKPVAGQEVRIAEDGEILVRGESVAGNTDPEGWLHTGDLGRLDDDGRLYYIGRRKDLIVTSEGLNVSPDDVEAVLNRLPGVKDSAVVSIDDQVHASLILSDGGDHSAAAEDIVREANAQLETHQRIQHWSIWPQEDFPRTASTLKTKRADVAAQIRSGEIPSKTAELRALSSMSSLERAELMLELEARHGIEIDEEAFTRAQSIEDLTHFTRQPGEPAKAHAPLWPLSFPARLLRGIFQNGIARPLLRRYLPMTVVGIENLSNAEPPVIFAANHTSHLDTPAILAALPRAWRERIAPAVRAEYFRPHFEPQLFSTREVLRSRLQYIAARLLYNCYPLPQEMAGLNRAFRYTADLVSRRYCPLVFPEGARTTDRRINRFRSGIGMMAVRLRTPVIPVYVGGLFEVLSAQDSWPKRGAVRVVFGEPMSFAAGTSIENATQAIETAVRRASIG